MKKLATATLATLVATSALVATTAGAVEASSRCGNVAGYIVCATDRDHTDTLEIDWGGGDLTKVDVRCSSGEWKTNGFNPGDFLVKEIVEAWCF